ncbi:MAG: carbohydrate ABC transporter permease [Anaerolineae bacterium]|nr:carbohydrate ABC transporter permease [Anaerolineae bacterium]
MTAKNPRSPWINRIGTALLLAAALFWLVPLIWTVLVSIRPPDESLVQGNIFFGSQITLTNFEGAFRNVNWGMQYITTLIFVFGVLAVQVVTITLAGYAFARLKFFGRNVLFIAILMQLMIPTAVLLVPNFATIRALGLFDTKLALMMPYFGSAFGTFLMRQTFRQVPLDLEDAAKIDGANWIQVLRNVYLPSAMPALTAFSLVSISSHWNEVLWPFIITQSDYNRPLTVGLTQMIRTTEVGALYGQMTASVLIVVAPLLVLFMIFQRQFISSFLRSGIK